MPEEGESVGAETGRDVPWTSTIGVRAPHDLLLKNSLHTSCVAGVLVDNYASDLLFPPWNQWTEVRRCPDVEARRRENLSADGGIMSIIASRFIPKKVPSTKNARELTTRASHE
ncbi:hypothetical protein EMCG_00323 [[Emmonsia] crescens]|uniref:Uncharacterized protein n=1 Tax=[Emmonsia] crescens TaxID=73230 RepID=A0A0G2HWV1_9EURO|nr:hypothetical protein EMCG_00323 [Emmonsia crescens UAMH 3008]